MYLIQGAKLSHQPGEWQLVADEEFHLCTATTTSVITLNPATVWFKKFNVINVNIN